MLNYPTGRSLRYGFPTLMTSDSKGRGRKKAGQLLKAGYWVVVFFILHFCVFFVINMPDNLFSFKHLTNIGILMCSSLHWSQLTGTIVAWFFSLPQFSRSPQSRACLSHLITDTNFPGWFLGFSAWKASDGSRDAHKDTFASLDMHTETHKWRHTHIAGTAGYCNVFCGMLEFVAEWRQIVDWRKVFRFTFQIRYCVFVINRYINTGYVLILLLGITFRNWQTKKYFF